MAEAQAELTSLRGAFNAIAIQDHGQIYNTDLHEGARARIHARLRRHDRRRAMAREESRGGHYRTDFESRDDRTGSPTPWPEGRPAA
jgi:succinate dehydrogenase / fumarate reductase flavoprotein subunit